MLEIDAINAGYGEAQVLRDLSLRVEKRIEGTDACDCPTVSEGAGGGALLLRRPQRRLRWDRR